MKYKENGEIDLKNFKFEVAVAGGLGLRTSVSDGSDDLPELEPVVVTEDDVDEENEEGYYEEDVSNVLLDFP